MMDDTTKVFFLLAVGILIGMIGIGTAAAIWDSDVEADWYSKEEKVIRYDESMYQLVPVKIAVEQDLQPWQIEKLMKQFKETEKMSDETTISPAVK
jgi:hypothetical protein